MSGSRWGCTNFLDASGDISSTVELLHPKESLANFGRTWPLLLTHNGGEQPLVRTFNPIFKMKHTGVGSWSW